MKRPLRDRSYRPAVRPPGALPCAQSSRNHRSWRARVLDGGKIRRLAVEVHGDDPDGPRCDLRRRVGGIERVDSSASTNTGASPPEADRLDVGTPCGRHEDLVTRSDALGPHVNQERRSRSCQHRVCHAVSRASSASVAALRAEDVLPGIDRGQHGALELIVDRGRDSGIGTGLGAVYTVVEPACIDIRARPCGAATPTGPPPRRWPGARTPSRAERGSAPTGTRVEECLELQSQRLSARSRAPVPVSTASQVPPRQMLARWRVTTDAL